MQELSGLFKFHDWEQLEARLEKVAPSVRSFTSRDGTVRFLVTLADGKSVETVLIPFHRKYTVCLSSQVGCQVKCSFCFTGSLKEFRNLDADEILAQYFIATLQLRKEDKLAPLPNIVFMGQGEPLHNFESVKSAISQLMNPTGLYLGPRQITVSTAGHGPGLQRFPELGGVNLAVSLHAANDRLRTELIPLNRAFPLADLRRLFGQLASTLKKRQFITLEYLLLHKVNDQREGAKELIEFCVGLPVIINLIPFNEYPGGLYRRPPLDQVDKFKQWLVEAGLRVMIRTTKGDEVSAACGQLALQV